jgi:hypothetical protein
LFALAARCLAFLLSPPLCAALLSQIDKGGLDAFLVKPVAERERPEDTWITRVDDPHASGALAYLTAAANALKKADSIQAGAGGVQTGERSGRAARLVLVTLGRREYREPLLLKAGLEILSYEKLQPTESMRRSSSSTSHGGASWEDVDLKLVVATAKAEAR